MKKPVELKDHHLWAETINSVKPLGYKVVKPASLKLKIRNPVLNEAEAPIPSLAKIHRTAQQIFAPNLGKIIASPPPLQRPERRTEQKMIRGNVEIDARLDLHGYGLELAREKLLRFLSQCQAQGFRVVLVITGKGASPFATHTLHGRTAFLSPEREGRLRRNVPEWLHETAFRHFVTSYQPAHPKHGGGGAMYVKLRRIKGNE